MFFSEANGARRLVDSVGTTGYGYTSFGALQSEDGPWDNDTVSLSYTHHRRTGLSLTQPNSSPWAQSYTYDRMHRLTNLTSTAGAFATEYYTGASTLLRKLNAARLWKIASRFACAKVLE